MQLSLPLEKQPILCYLAKASHFERKPGGTKSVDNCRDDLNQSLFVTFCLRKPDEQRLETCVLGSDIRLDKTEVDTRQLIPHRFLTSEDGIASRLDSDIALECDFNWNRRLANISIEQTAKAYSVDSKALRVTA